MSVSKLVTALKVISSIIYVSHAADNQPPVTPSTVPSLNISLEGKKSIEGYMYVVANELSVNNSESIYYRLRKDLLTDYHRDIRPVWHPSDHLNITVAAFLYQIILVLLGSLCVVLEGTTVDYLLSNELSTNIDQSSNTIKLTAGIQMNWHDAFLRWNPAYYENVTKIFLPAQQVWTPELTVLYSVDSQTMSIPHQYLEVEVQYDGSVIFFVSFTSHSLCPFDVKKFPFDEQACKIQFGSLVHTTDTLDVTPQHGVNLEEFYDNQEWELSTVIFSKVSRSSNHTSRKHPYGVLVLELFISRQPFYYIFILVIPGALITFVAVVGFHCPTTSRPTREAKFHMGLLTLLSMSVLLVGVADTLPKFSTASIPGKRGSFSGVPLLGIYYLSLLIIIMMSTITTSFFVVIERWVSETDQMSWWMKWLLSQNSNIAQTCTLPLLLAHSNAGITPEKSADNLEETTYEDNQILQLSDTGSMPLRQNGEVSTQPHKSHGPGGSTPRMTRRIRRCTSSDLQRHAHRNLFPEVKPPKAQEVHLQQHLLPSDSKMGINLASPEHCSTNLTERESVIALHNISALEAQLSYTSELLTDIKGVLSSVSHKQELSRHVTNVVNRMQFISFVFYLSTMLVSLLMFFFHGWY